MLKLFFGGVTNTISSVSILVIAGYMVYILKNREAYEHWGVALLIFLIFGTFMSAMSGTRDGIGTPGGFPTQGKLFISLCLLGGAGFLTGLIALITKFTKITGFFKYGCYILMLIIVVKTILVEGNRIIKYLK